MRNDVRKVGDPSYEDLVRGWEGSPLMPIVAMWRELGPTGWDLSDWVGTIGVGLLAWACMWVACLWASL